MSTVYVKYGKYSDMYGETNYHDWCHIWLIMQKLIMFSDMKSYVNFLGPQSLTYRISRREWSLLRTAWAVLLKKNQVPPKCTTHWKLHEMFLSPPPSAQKRALVKPGIRFLLTSTTRKNRVKALKWGWRRQKSAVCGISVKFCSYCSDPCPPFYKLSPALNNNFLILVGKWNDFVSWW